MSSRVLLIDVHLNIIILLLLFLLLLALSHALPEKQYDRILTVQFQFSIICSLKVEYRWK